ncbi:MAG: YkgJ family cysteine cluster protein [Deltaproteobacteria bacterium]|nr:YkgJ family cysteine cluster protein [Deltaproteobacteria bacterium]
MDFKNHREHTLKYEPYLDRLSAIFRKMDERYDETAGKYGFVCTGCMESCCKTRFYHHTLIEYFYLKRGLESLNSKDRMIIHSKALEVKSQWESPATPDPSGVMCPLNEAGRCRLYAHRPMICRLHGIPHELNHPTKGRAIGPGCHEFVIQCGEKSYIPFDRTPLYQELADLEKSFRQETGLGVKMKMTIAEMLAGSQNE